MKTQDRWRSIARMMYSSWCAWMMGFMVVISGCSDLVNGTDFPQELMDPKAVKTERGALGLYQMVLQQFRVAYAGGDASELSYEETETRMYTRITALLTDEVQRVQGDNPFPESYVERIDSRLLFANNPNVDGVDGPYTGLHGVRLSSQEARGVLQKYARNLPSALLGHMYTIEGLTAVMLAELYCSGIPLSRLDFEKDYTLTHGFRTDEVYQHALILFDSAAPLVSDSIRIQHLLSLARARALLGLGRVSEAAAAVSRVPTDFTYSMAYTTTTLSRSDRKYVPTPGIELYGDAEGGNGLLFRSSNDPRTQLPTLTNAGSPLSLVTGIEARLIEAELQLVNNDGQWLRTLNHLRTTCEDSNVCPTPIPNGTGNVGGLAPLADPANGAPFADTAAFRQRLKLIFSERAYWMFLTGRRQGDLRRLVRHYRQPAHEVYPVGTYWFTGYGNDLNLPIPAEERERNHLYKGCYNRDA